MRKILLCTTAMLLFSGVAFAQNVTDTVTIQEDMQINSAPTEVFGAAANASGGVNTDMVEQAADASNPLGDPLYTPNDDSNQNQSSVSVAPVPSQETAAQAPQATSEPQIKPVVQESQQGILQPDEMPLPQPSTRIENELYQSGNDIIDVQAYPINDVSTVTEPNIQPAIVAQ